MKQRILRVCFLTCLAFCLLLSGRIAWAQDPTAEGSYEASPPCIYDFGDQVFPFTVATGGTTTTKKAEVRAVVRYPRDKKTHSIPFGKHFPLLLFLHGNHVVCRKIEYFDVAKTMVKEVSLVNKWPCGPDVPKVSFT